MANFEWTSDPCTARVVLIKMFMVNFYRYEKIWKGQLWSSCQKTANRTGQHQVSSGENDYFYLFLLILWFQENNVLPSSRKCDTCDLVLTTVYSHRRYHYFHCKKCSKKYSIRNGSFLSNASISLRKFILLVYIFVTNFWTYKGCITNL